MSFLSKRLRQILWFVGLWLGGVATVVAVAGIIRLAIFSF